MVGRASKRRPENDTENTNAETSLVDHDANDVNMMDVEQMEWTDAQQSMYPGDPFLPVQLLPSDLLSISGLDDLSFHAFPDSVSGTDPFAGGHAFQPTNGNHSTSNPSLNAASSMEAVPTATPETTASNGSSNGAHTRSPPPGFPALPISMSPEYEKYNAVTSVEPIFVLARVALYLENQLRDESLPLDKTLMVVKGALKELMDIVNVAQTMVSIACRALIFASIQTIVRLYSRSLARHRQGAQGQPEARFKLGSFEIDPEDQLRLQNQAIAAELGRCIRQIKKLSKDWGKACEKGEQCQGVKHYHTMAKHMEELRDDIEAHQMKDITEVLEKTSVHDKRLMHPLI